MPVILGRERLPRESGHEPFRAGQQRLEAVRMTNEAEQLALKLEPRSHGLWRPPLEAAPQRLEAVRSAPEFGRERPEGR